MISASSLARRAAVGALILTVAAGTAACGSKSLTDNFTSKMGASDLQAAGGIGGTMSFTLAGQKYDGSFTGSFKANGNDSYTTMTTTILGQTSTNETYDVGDSEYTRTDSGSWTKAARGSSGLSLQKLVSSGIVDKGVETKNGQQLHRLELNKEPTANDLFSDPSMQNGTFSVVFWAKDDGTPAAMTVTGTWSQDMSGQTAQASMTMDFTIDTLSGVTVTAPQI